MASTDKIGPPENYVTTAVALMNLSESQKLEEFCLVLFDEEALDVDKVGVQAYQARKILDAWVLVALSIQVEEKSVLPALGMVLVALHLGESARLLLKKGRVADSHINLLVLPYRAFQNAIILPDPILALLTTILTSHS